MAGPRLLALDQSGVPDRSISLKLRGQLAYFATIPNGEGAPALGENEYFFDAEDTARTLDDGVLMLVSPLDTANMTEVEISEEQEDLLSWLCQNKIQHVRVLE